MEEKVDIIIPTCKPLPAVWKVIQQIEMNTEIPHRIIATCQMTSASKNRNYGLSIAQSSIIIMVDDDMMGFFPGWAARMLEPFEKVKKCCMVSARLLDCSGKPGQTSSDNYDMVSKWPVVARKVMPSACIAFIDIGLRFDEGFIGSGWEDSVTEDTPIYIRDRDGIDIVPISDLHDFGLFDRCPLQGIEVWDGFEWTRARYVYQHRVSKPMYRVVTASGVLDLTGDHSLFRKFKPIKPSSLKVGQSVDVANLPYAPERGLMLEEDVAWVLGLFCAEGCSNIYDSSWGKYPTKMSVTKIDMQDKKTLERAKVVLDATIGDWKIEKHGKMYRLKSVGPGQREIAEQFIAMCYTRQREKRVPQEVLNGRHTVKEAFIEGYWKGDGHVERRGNSVRKSCCSKSKTLIAGVQHLLSTLGERTSVLTRKDKPNITTLRILNNRDKAQYDGEVRKVSSEHGDPLFVYDISTDSGRFTTALGRIVAHNTDVCFQFAARDPEYQFIINNDCRLTHRNEGKNQNEVYQQNWDHFGSKWGKRMSPVEEEEE